MSGLLQAVAFFAGLAFAVLIACGIAAIASDAIIGVIRHFTKED